MAKYELIEYDTCGNRETGFEVNNVFRTGIIYEISDDDMEEDVIGKLCEEEKMFPGIMGKVRRTWLVPEARNKIRVADGMIDYEFAIEIEIAETGEPIGRLELGDI